MTDRAAAGAAAVAHLAEERDVAQPDVAGDLDLLGRLQRVRAQAVDVGGVQPRVVEGGQDGPARQLLLGAGHRLAERGLPDAGDGGAVGVAVLMGVAVLTSP